jgi:sugar/nucleoside kinase (ribokinase family)
MAQAKLYDVCTAGLLCLDILPKIPKKSATEIASLLAPGKLLNVGKPVFHTGGAVSNTGIVVTKLGLKVLFMSQVGDDMFGRMTVDLLQEYGETKGILQASGEDSSYSVIIAFPGVDRIILHNPGCNNTFSSKSPDYGLIEKCRLFHFGYPPLMKRVYLNNGRELKKIFQRVSSKEVITSLDASLPDPDSESGRVEWRSVLKNVLPHVDIFTPSLEEAMYFLDPKSYLWKKYQDPDFAGTLPFVDYKRMAEEFLEMGCGMVMLKAGERGIYLRTSNASRLKNLGQVAVKSAAEWPDRELWAPSYVPKVIVSATGAGDATVGGFLTALLKDYGPERSLRVAACVGYQNLRALDTTSGIGTWSETLRGIRTLPFYDLGWKATEASWDKSAKIWKGAADRA